MTQKKTKSKSKSKGASKVGIKTKAPLVSKAGYKPGTRYCGGGKLKH